MRITIFSIGSRGDVQPYVALGRGLQAAGHTVRVATHDEFAAFVQSWGLGLFSLQGNPRKALESDEGRAWLETANNPVTFFRRLRRLAEPALEQLLVEIRSACQDTDAILFSPLSSPAAHVAEKLKIPAYAAYLQPNTPTRAFPSPTAYAGPNLGGAFNWLSQVAVEQLAWQMLFRSRINRWRTESLELPPVSIWGPYRQLRGRAPHLYGYSPTVLPKPADWGPCVHVTGYWFLDPPDDWQPPADLVDFLESGPPPVYIGFGSMNNRDPKAVTEIVLATLARTGHRGVLLTGWGGLDVTGLPDSVFTVSDIPHAWLFRRTAAVVHHGGAGTTGAALRSGVPSIVVPFFADQPFWARQVHRLGVGPKPIPRKQLSVEQLVDAINTAVSDQAMRRRAAEIGQRIQQEDGVARAVEAFHRHLHGLEAQWLAPTGSKMRTPCP
jgi:sterol 3beta-glucosyltransferase